MRRALLAALLALAAALALPACGDDERAARPAIERIEVGEGAGSAVVFRPGDAEGRLPGVLFLHGWGAVEPDSYAPWIRHLVAQGNQVIYPRYQTSPIMLPGLALGNAVLGVRAAQRRVPVQEGSLVVAGHSAGGALAADYAATAGTRGLPRPLAIFAVYPGRRLPRLPLGLPERDPARIPAGTEIVALAGARDTIVGRSSARRIVGGATRVPERRRTYRVVRGAAVADHLGPLERSPAARRAFWAPLDRLIDRARARG